MSAKEEVIRVRIDPGLKEAAGSLFQRLGLTISEAFRLFLVQSVERRGLPFAVEIPNKETLEALEAVDRGKVVKTSISEIESLWRKNERSVPVGKVRKGRRKGC
jgi:DNA-damage-inducible protein J